mgnify:FL=1|jgi:hypothetical protein
MTVSNTNILLLAGANPRNREWLHQLAGYLKSHEIEAEIFPYLHWDNQTEIDIKNEICRFKEYIKSLEPTIVIAKSAGAIIGMNAVLNGAAVDKMVIIGLPIAYMAEKRIDVNQLISSISVPTLCIQASKDPMGNYHEVNELCSRQPLIEVVKVTAADHAYTDLTSVVRHIETFIHDS